MKTYLLNSAVMPSGNYGIYIYHPAGIYDLRIVASRIAAGEFGYESRIGYPQNIDLIERWTGHRIPLDRSACFFESGDHALIMRLKYRVVPGRKGAPVTDDPDDWEFGWVEFGH